MPTGGIWSHPPIGLLVRAALTILERCVHGGTGVAADAPRGSTDHDEGKEGAKVGGRCVVSNGRRSESIASVNGKRGCLGGWCHGEISRITISQ